MWLFKMPMLRINENIEIDEKELKEDYIRSSGPGGQNVNKVSTAVQLRFNIDKSKALAEDIKARLHILFPNRINSEGELIIHANSYRSQLKNRRDALLRLIELLASGAEKPKKRLKMKPSMNAKMKRLESKKRRSEIKEFRKKVF